MADFLHSYPYRDTNARARCFLWHHEAAVVQYIRGGGYELYTCKCGKYEWTFGEPKRRVGAK